MTDHAFDAADVLGDLSVALHRYRARRRRRGLIVSTALAACAATGVALGASYGDWWSGGAPPVNPEAVSRQLDGTGLRGGALTPDVTRARTVARIEGAALVAAPTRHGGYCLVPSVSGEPDLGFSCQDGPLTRAGGGSVLYTWAGTAGGSLRWIAYGRITDSRAAAVEVTGAGTPVRAVLARGGFFLVELPPATWASLANDRRNLVVRDSSGAPVRTTCIGWGPAPASGAQGRRYASDASQPGCVDEPPPRAAAFEPLEQPVPLPVLKGADVLTGAPLDTAAFAGKPGFLVVWQSYCGPCAELLPAVQAFATAHPEAQVLGLDVLDLEPDAVALIRRVKLTFPSLSAGPALLDALGVEGLPTILAFDANGRIRTAASGVTSAGVLAAELERLEAPKGG